MNGSKFIPFDNSFKPVNCDIFSGKFLLATKAMEEESTFSSLINFDPLPVKTHRLGILSFARRCLKNIIEHEGNEKVFLSLIEFH